MFFSYNSIGDLMNKEKLNGIIIDAAHGGIAYTLIYPKLNSNVPINNHFSFFCDWINWTNSNFFYKFINYNTI